MKKTQHQSCSCSENSELLAQAERSRQIINAIFDSTQSFILLISMEYKIMFFNKKAMQASKLLYGMDLKVGDDIANYQRAEDEKVFETFRENFTKATTSGNIIVSEREMKFGNKINWFRSEYTPVYNEDKMIGVALRVVDISERKNREKQIENQNEQLWKISWIQSHHTRQPIATILGLIHILDKTSLTEDNQNIIRMLEAEIDKLDFVIRDTVIRANSASNQL